MKVALLTRLKHLEEVRATENLPAAEFQVGYVKRLPADYIGDRHLVTVGGDPDGLYHWEEQPGPEPDEGRRNFPPPFRVVLTFPEDKPPAPRVREPNSPMEN